MEETEYEVRIDDNFLRGDHVDGQVLQHTDLNELESVAKIAINANYEDIQKLQDGTIMIGNAERINGAELSTYSEETLQNSDTKVPTSMQVKQYVDTEIENLDLSSYYTKTETDSLLGDKADVSSVPTKTSDLTNDSNFVNSSSLQSTLSNYYTKTEVDNIHNITGTQANPIDLATLPNGLYKVTGYVTYSNYHYSIFTTVSDELDGAIITIGSEYVPTRGAIDDPDDDYLRAKSGRILLIVKSSNVLIGNIVVTEQYGGEMYWGIDYTVAMDYNKMMTYLNEEYIKVLTGNIDFNNFDDQDEDFLQDGVYLAKNVRAHIGTSNIDIGDNDVGALISLSWLDNSIRQITIFGSDKNGYVYTIIDNGDDTYSATQYEILTTSIFEDENDINYLPYYNMNWFFSEVFPYLHEEFVPQLLYKNSTAAPTTFASGDITLSNYRHADGELMLALPELIEIFYLDEASGKTLSSGKLTVRDLQDNVYPTFTLKDVYITNGVVHQVERTITTSVIFSGELNLQEQLKLTFGDATVSSSSSSTTSTDNSKLIPIYIFGYNYIINGYSNNLPYGSQLGE